MRAPPKTHMGMSGTSAVAAMRTAPDLISLTSIERLIVASGKMPTSSPARRYATAVSSDWAPCSRSTGMWCMPFINGPPSQCRKTESFAMKRTRRLPRRSAGFPARAKSRKLV